MMRQFELLERVQEYKPDADEMLLNKAYVYAMQKHGEQTRANGDPYFSHPLEVAAILTDMHLDEATIATALLHDTIEDTDATRNEIDGLFGEDIGALVDGLTKIQQIDFKSKQVAQAENLRKLLLAVSSDVRVLLVKLADRLHNMRTLHFVPDHKRGRISQETMDIYAPLAGRMGMQDMREELEDLSFRYLFPEAHEALVQRLSELGNENRDVVADIRDTLDFELTEQGILATVIGRQKRPYSIFRKMERKALSFEQLSDIFGFRIVVDNVADCYRALGVMHTKWPTVPGRFKDYISTPKQNDYRSLHTTIVGPSKRRVELQIRTHGMHSIADYGVAAHALYKDDVKSLNSDLEAESGAYVWLRRTIELLAEGENAEDFLENTKLELFLDQVFCFTPKGALIALPQRATAVDFAYALHTDIGDTCVGCKINGRMTPVTSELHNGDEVEIIRAKKQIHPAAWEATAVTGKARSAIRRMHRVNQTKHHTAIGTSLLRYAMNQVGHAYDSEKLQPIVKNFGFQWSKELVAAVGKGDVNADAVLDALKLSAPEPLDEEEGDQQEMQDRLKESVTALSYSGLQDQLPIRFSPQGGALPGDRIVGILEPETGITIYAIQSPSLALLEDSETWLDMQWDLPENSDAVFPATMDIQVHNIPGALAKIAETVADNAGNITDISMNSNSENIVHMQINLEIPSVKHLNNTMNALRANQLVSQVNRRIG